MKLTLLILLLAGVVSATQDLRGSEAAQDLESMEDAKDGVLRALKSKRCKRDGDCGNNEECDDGECVTKSRKGRRTFRQGRCDQSKDCGSSDIFRCNDGKCELRSKYSNRRFFGSCSRTSQCLDEDVFRCNKNRERCEIRPEYRRYFDSSRRGGCNTTVKAAVVLTDDGDESRCAKRLRSNNSMTRNLHPNRMRDFSIARVGDCSSTRVRNRMENLESGGSTRKDVKMVFVVMSEDDFSNKCRRAIRDLPDELEEDLSCRDIRRMHGNRSSNSDDVLVIRLNRESQCTTSKLEKKVLDAADLN